MHCCRSEGSLTAVTNKLSVSIEWHSNNVRAVVCVAYACLFVITGVQTNILCMFYCHTTEGCMLESAGISCAPSSASVRVSLHLTDSLWDVLTVILLPITNTEQCTRVSRDKHVIAPMYAHLGKRLHQRRRKPSIWVGLPGQRTMVYLMVRCQCWAGRR